MIGIGNQLRQNSVLLLVLRTGLQLFFLVHKPVKICSGTRISNQSENDIPQQVRVIDRRWGDTSGGMLVPQAKIIR